jgi:hypothetical protein
MKSGVFWDVAPYGSCKTDVSVELGVSFIRVTRIGKLGTTLVACVGCKLQLALTRKGHTR